MCGTTPGSVETFAEQVCMPIRGRVECIDRCISQIVASLNAGNVQTVASCCGHGKLFGSIILQDGRCLVICPDLETHNSVIKRCRDDEEKVGWPSKMNVINHVSAIFGGNLSERESEIVSEAVAFQNFKIIKAERKLKRKAFK